MLALKNRLAKEKDFQNVFKKGKSFKQDFLVIKTAKSKLKDSRFGFVAGKNFSKKATERNKIKRRLREIIKKRFNQIKTGTDVVLIVMPGAENNFNKIEETLSKLLKKSGLL